MTRSKGYAKFLIDGKRSAHENLNSLPTARLFETFSGMGRD